MGLESPWGTNTGQQSGDKQSSVEHGTANCVFSASDTLMPWLVGQWDVENAAVCLHALQCMCMDYFVPGHADDQPLSALRTGKIGYARVLVDTAYSTPELQFIFLNCLVSSWYRVWCLSGNCILNVPLENYYQYSRHCYSNIRHL